MLERLTGLPDGVYGVRARGKVTKEDYEEVLRPLLSEVRSEGKRVRFVYHFPPEFDGFSAMGAWEDVRLGFQHLRLLARCAIVTDKPWLRESSRLLGVMLPCPLECFANEHWNRALAWVGAAPEATHLTHHLHTDTGVLEVKLEGPLSAEDFDAVALTADSWIETHGELAGLLFRVEAFRGWEDLGSLFRHFAFVRDHHRKVQRVALVANHTIAEFAPQIARHFVAAELKHFPPDQAKDAMTWVAAGTREHRPEASASSSSPAARRWPD